MSRWRARKIPETYSESVASSSSFYGSSISQSTGATSAADAAFNVCDTLPAIHPSVLVMQTQKSNAPDCCIDPRLTSIGPTPPNNQIISDSGNWCHEAQTISDDATLQEIGDALPILHSSGLSQHCQTNDFDIAFHEDPVKSQDLVSDSQMWLHTWIATNPDKMPNERELASLKTLLGLPETEIVAWLSQRIYLVPLSNSEAEVANTQDGPHRTRTKRYRPKCRRSKHRFRHVAETRDATRVLECTHGCGKSFDVKGQWTRHELSNIEEWKCHECKFISPRKDKLRKHLQQHHSFRGALKQSRRHQLLQPGARPCVFCLKSFNNWSELLSHVAAHFQGRIAGGPWTMARWNKAVDQNCDTDDSADDDDDDSHDDHDANDEDEDSYDNAAQEPGRSTSKDKGAMVPAFGWSAGDIAVAIKIIWHIIKAFDHTKGAKKQYAASCAFLRSFATVLERMKLQIDNAESTQLQDQLLKHAETISTAYADFDQYLDKKYALSSSKSGDVRRIIAAIRWSLDDLHEKVQKLQQKVVNAVQLFQTLIVQEIQIQVSKIASELRGAQDGSERRDDLLKSISSTIAQITKQNESLQQASTDYQSSLDEQRNEQDERGDATKPKLEEISQSQEKLTQSLSELTECIEKQRESAPQSEVTEWNAFADQAEEQRVLSEGAQARTQQELNRNANLLDGTRKMTGNQRVGDLAQKTEGISQIFGSLPPAGLGKKLFGGGSSAPPARGTSDTTSLPPSQTSGQVWRMRTSQPLPDIRSLPPPPTRYVRAESTELSTLKRSAAVTAAQKPQTNPLLKPALPPRAISVPLCLPSPKSGYVLSERDSGQQRSPALPPRPIPHSRPPPSSVETTSSFRSVSPTSTGSVSPPKLPPRKLAENHVGAHNHRPPAMSTILHSDDNTEDTATTVRDLIIRFEGARLIGVRSAEN